MKQYEVLVVDDQTPEGQSFADLIQTKTGLRCIATDDPDEAIKIAESTSLSVLVLDEGMPRMSGTNLYARLRKIAPHAGALMLTQEDDAKAAGAAMRLGYKDRLHKANIDDLATTVLRLHIGSIAARARESQIIAQLPLPRRLFRRTPASATIVAIDLLDERFVDDKEWRELVEVNAGQERKVSAQRTLSHTVTFEDEESESIASELGIKVSELSAKIMTTLTNRTKQSFSTATTTVEILEDSFRLPEEPSDPNQLHVRSRQFQYAPEYRRFRIVIRVSCRQCRHDRFIPAVILVATDVIALRQVDYMSDKSIREIPTGSRRLSKAVIP